MPIIEPKTPGCGLICGSANFGLPV
jgi:hypothetical protein